MAVASSAVPRMCTSRVVEQVDSPVHNTTVTQFTMSHNKNKKFELMLTRRAKAYKPSSSCSLTVSLSQAISSQFNLRACAAAEDRKNK